MKGWAFDDCDLEGTLMGIADFSGNRKQIFGQLASYVLIQTAFGEDQ